MSLISIQKQIGQTTVELSFSLKTLNYNGDLIYVYGAVQMNHFLRDITMHAIMSDLPG